MNTFLDVRKSAQEHRDFVTSLDEFQKDIAKKEQQAKNTSTRSTSSIAVRGNISTSTANDRKSYRDWDKFDVEEACKDLDYIPTKDVKAVEREAVMADLESSLIEKEKGNALFKVQKYQKAIVCYTKSYNLNAGDITPILNRAICYLKLECFEDAQDDCSFVLEIEKKNVKAFWRRGVSRIGLNDLINARKDLEFALTLEPTNKSIKLELEKVDTLEGKTAKKKVSPPVAPVKVQVKREQQINKPKAVINTEKRTRIEIREVGNPEDYLKMGEQKKEESIFLSEVSTKRKKVETAVIIQNTETSNPTAISKSNKDSQIESITDKEIESGESTKPIKDAIPQSSKTQPNNSSLPNSNNNNNHKILITETTKQPYQISPTPPKSMFEFEIEWKNVKGDLSLTFQLLQKIDPTNFKNIFQSSFEEHYLTAFVKVLKLMYVPQGMFKEALGVLKGVTEVNRFTMIVMFLGSKEKKELQDLFLLMLGGGISESDVKFLRDKFC